MGCTIRVERGSQILVEPWVPSVLDVIEVIHVLDHVVHMPSPAKQWRSVQPVCLEGIELRQAGEFNKAVERASGKRPSAETEEIDLIPGLISLHQESIGLPNVDTDSIAKRRTADGCHRAGSHPFVIVGNDRFAALPGIGQ
ncbi:hypothetical protein D3C71_1571130 [compost metagenome]